MGTPGIQFAAGVGFIISGGRWGELMGEMVALSVVF